MRTFCAGVLVALCLLSSSVPAVAQDDATRSAARSMGYEGVQAYQKGDYTDAVDKLGRAFAVAKVPTLGLWYARALAKTGKLLEASERYGEVTRLEVSEGKVKEQKQAQQEAAAENAVLQPRIAALTITLGGENREVTVTVDGVAIPQMLIGVARPANPGSHTVKLTIAGREQEQTVTLTEGEKKQLVFDTALPVATATPPPEPAATQKEPGEVVTALPSERTSTEGKLQRTLGWVAVGIGGAGLVTGTVSGLLVMSKKRQLDGVCLDGVCAPEQRSLRESYNSLRPVSTVGFMVGAVGLGVGITLLLTAPKNSSMHASAWVGVDSVAIKGAF